MPIRVLIVAGWPAVRAGLNALLLDALDCEVVGEANGNTELERFLNDAAPDVVLCDVLPGEAVEIVEILSGSDTALVLLGEERSDYRLLTDADLPGWAYLRREADRTEILGAIRAAVAGLVAMDRSLAPLLTVPAIPAPRELETSPGETLTARENEVLQLIAQGLANKQIAARLAISQHTVKFHVAAVLAKLGAASRTEAVTIGARRGVVTL